MEKREPSYTVGNINWDSHYGEQHRFFKKLKIQLVCVRVCVNCSAVSDSTTPWTVACQVPLSMEFSRILDSGE